MNCNLSIIVPVYNVEDYLYECINSILNQTFTDYELILINDGSSDKSGEICNIFKKKDSRIKVIHKENGGQASARNIGLKIANGDYIGFIDSDDWIDKEMYSTLLNHGIKNKSDIVACNFKIMDDKGKFKLNTTDIDNLEFDKEAAIKEVYNNKILSFSPCNKIYKKELFNDLEFLEGFILEDMDISYKLINKSTSISYLKEALYYYRYNNKSTLRSQFSLKRLDEYIVMRNMYNFYADNYPEISDLVYSKLFISNTTLYMLIEIYYQVPMDDYQYLIKFEKNILKRLLKNKEIDIKYKFKILLFLLSPKLSIKIFGMKYKYSVRNVEETNEDCGASILRQ